MNSTTQKIAASRSVLDRCVGVFDRSLKTLTGSLHAQRPTPKPEQTTQSNDENQLLSAAEQRHAAGLMRVNHVGEVCAQGLYMGQSVFAKNKELIEFLQQSADEEVDHLVWCQERLQQLSAKPSVLNPLWYAGAFGLGVLASRWGEGISLAFVVETERQVEAHLDHHLEELPLTDLSSRAIVAQMRQDEITHGRNADSLGAQKLPPGVSIIMKAFAKVMTTVAYRI